MPNNRNRGNGYERDIVNELKEIGFTDSVTSRAESRNMDNKGVDIFGDSLPFHIQCKNYVKYPDIHGLLTSELLPTDKPLVVIHKKTKKASTRFMTQGEYAYLKKQDFYDLINKDKLIDLITSKLSEFALNAIEQEIDFDGSKTHYTDLLTKILKP